MLETPGTHRTSGQRGVVRQEDLSKLLRLVGRSAGISGSMQNPNRLPPILGEDNMIVGAFWELIADRREADTISR